MLGIRASEVNTWYVAGNWRLRLSFFKMWSKEPTVYVSLNSKYIDVNLLLTLSAQIAHLLSSLFKMCNGSVLDRAARRICIKASRFREVELELVERVKLQTDTDTYVCFSNIYLEHSRNCRKWHFCLFLTILSSTGFVIGRVRLDARVAKAKSNAIL